MQLDRNTLSRILELDDANLWQTIVLIGKEAGFDLSKQKMSESDMAKLRAALSGATDKDIRRAAEQLEMRKKKMGGKS